MQPYLLPTNDSYAPTDMHIETYPFVTTKNSSTSTADSYTDPSNFYGYEDVQEERTDPDLLMRFNSLGLNELDDEDEKIAQTPGPHRHASEIVSLKETFEVPSKLPHGSLQFTGSFKVPRNPHNTFASSKVLTSNIAPPRLVSPTIQNTPLYIPYSTNNLSQSMSTIPLCSVPQYYVCQPEFVHIPMMYGYYDYAKVTPKPEPRKFLSSKKQAYPLRSPTVSELPATVCTELSEKAVTLIKEYERSGDYVILAGEIGKLAKVQSGSRFLQKEVEKADNEFLLFMLKEVCLLL